MKKIIYVISGEGFKTSWVYEKNTCEGFTVQEFDKLGHEVQRTFNTCYEVEQTILNIIKDSDFTKIYQKNDIIVILDND